MSPPAPQRKFPWVLVIVAAFAGVGLSCVSCIGFTALGGFLGYVEAAETARNEPDAGAPIAALPEPAVDAEPEPLPAWRPHPRDFEELPTGRPEWANVTPASGQPARPRTLQIPNVAQLMEATSPRAFTTQDDAIMVCRLSIQARQWDRRGLFGVFTRPDPVVRVKVGRRQLAPIIGPEDRLVVHFSIPAADYTSRTRVEIRAYDRDLNRDDTIGRIRLRVGDQSIMQGHARWFSARCAILAREVSERLVDEALTAHQTLLSEAAPEILDAATQGLPYQHLLGSVQRRVRPIAALLDWDHAFTRRAVATMNALERDASALAAAHTSAQAETAPPEPVEVADGVSVRLHGVACGRAIPPPLRTVAPAWGCVLTFAARTPAPGSEWQARLSTGPWGDAPLPRHQPMTRSEGLTDAETELVFFADPAPPRPSELTLVYRDAPGGDPQRATFELR